VVAQLPADTVSLYSYALGSIDSEQFAEMVIDPADTGGTHILADGKATSSGEYFCEVKQLDPFSFTDVDFLKIDCEGYELEVLKGATETLARCRPAIIVEQKPHKLAANYGARGRPAVEFLLGLGLGYVLRREIGGDFILSVD
jgi:FkbM family methyltransferase